MVMVADSWGMGMGEDDITWATLLPDSATSNVQENYISLISPQKMWT